MRRKGYDGESLASPAPPHVRDSDDLRKTNPEEFAELFGYGYTEDVRREMEAAVLADDARNDDGVANELVPADDSADVAAEACEEESRSMLDDYLAPVEVHQRYATLRLQAGRTEEYIEASHRWSECMAQRGIAVPPDPFAAVAVVAVRAHAMSPEARLTDEGSWDLSEPELNDLQEFELSVRRADDQCRADSGASDVMYRLETDILDVLADEFPAFDGIDYEG